MKKLFLLALPALLISCSKETITEDEPPAVDPEVTYVRAEEAVSRYAVKSDGVVTCSMWPGQWYTTSMSDVVQVEEYGYLLKSDGTVWVMLLQDITNPTQVAGLSGITKISNSINPGGSVGHLLALKNDGTVWAMGINNFGQLGDNTTTNSTVPVQVSGLTNITDISCYNTFSLAVKADGTVWGWGANYNGEMGTAFPIGVTTPVPVQIPGIAGIAAVSAGPHFAVAMTTSGDVYTWGSNSVGQLGNGTTTSNAVPTLVAGLSGITQISTGHGLTSTLESYVLVLKSDGTVWSWGNNANGNIGDGTTTNRLTPVQVDYLTNIQYISGVGGSFAIDSENYLWAWGNNVTGALGIPSATGQGTVYYSPVRVPAN